ncbi:MAG: hypothetical protein ACLUS6_07320 [Dysosmobacter sp.]
MATPPPSHLTAATDKVVTGTTEYSVISGVDNVTTGVKNASIETYTYADARKDSGATKATDANTSYGVYTLFKDNGYVIAAVVVGDDAAATKNLVYSIKDSVELESYDKTEDEWTWTMKAVDAKGQGDHPHREERFSVRAEEDRHQGCLVSGEVRCQGQRGFC